MPRKYTRKISRHRKRTGGTYDIEMGPPVKQTYMGSVPPDPRRFDTYNSRIMQEINRPISPAQASAYFAGPNPEERRKMEEKYMGDEDPLNINPLNKPVNFSYDSYGGTRKRRHRKRHSSRKNISRKHYRTRK
jgi:hypothetical protein